MVLNMEISSRDDIIGSSSAPYQNHLANSYEEFTRSYGVGHHSLDNYLAEVTGNFYSASTGDCTPSASCEWSDPSVATQLSAAAIPWKAYIEDLDGGSGYDVNHNPFAYLTNVDQSKVVASGPGTANDSAMLSDLNSPTTPDFVFLTPDINDDGHNTGVAYGDRYLSRLIPEIQATSWYRQGGTIVLTYDEGNDAGQGQGEYTTGAGNNVLTLVISAGTAGKGQNASYVNHFGVLRGIEAAYGLPYLGQAANAANGQLPLR